MRLTVKRLILWWHSTGKGRVLYAALGHTTASYAEPGTPGVLPGAVNWAPRREGGGWGGEAPAANAGWQ